MLECNERLEVIFMKRNAGKMFVRIFFQSFFIVAVLLLTGILSYKAVMHFWHPKSKEAETAFQEDVTSVGATDEDIDGKAKNLIYCYDEETNEITNIVLQIWNDNNKKLTYVSIPVRTQLTISNSLYKKIILDDPEIPQVMKLSTITKYLDTEKAYEDETKIIEELLGTEINYYTTIPKVIYDTIFTQKNIEQSDNYDSVPMEIFSSKYKNKMKKLDTKDKLQKYIEEIYPDLQTNLTLEDKLNSLDLYDEISMSDVTFDLIKGNNFNNAYVIDTSLAAQQLEEIIGKVKN